MKRREFMTLIGGAAAVWPLAARAQQPAMPVVGFLSGSAATDRTQLVTAFREGLKEGGFVDGANVRIEFRWADLQYDRLPALAADLVQQKVAIIVTSGAVNSTLAAKAATATIPIVFVHGSDPIEAGLVPRLNRPGGNITGVTNFARELETKKLDLLRQLVPGARAIGLLVNPRNPNTFSEVDQMQAVASADGWRLEVIPVRAESELDAAFAAMAQHKVDAFLLTVDAIFGDLGERIAALEVRYALPGVGPPRGGGGVIGYGANALEGHRLAGVYAGRILKGEKPAELPVLQPSKFELIINQKMAKALGLTVPLTLLAIADEVIE
jgi:putative tryptophan/tyrosine transport system substrate-binding protein